MVKTGSMNAGFKTEIASMDQGHRKQFNLVTFVSFKVNCVAREGALGHVVRNRTD